MRLKFIQKIIDKICNKNEERLFFTKLQKQIKKRVQEIKGSKKIIKVAFLTQYITARQSIPIFEKMLKDKHFDPYFIVNPDVSRDKQNFDYQYNRTLTQLREIYGKERVLEGYNYEKKEFIDFSNDFDVMNTTNPYEGMAQEYFRIYYWAKKHIPIFYISYFYMGRCRITNSIIKGVNCNYFWKFFIENKEVLKIGKNKQILKGKNMVLTGYPKLDKMSEVKILNKKNKSIILSPHHLIGNNDTDIGCFLEYADFFLELPKKYPNIEFVFRPHPLLEVNLRKDEYWGNEKTKEYFDKMAKHKNVKMSLEGDYLELFANSDGLIHDCGSYTAEYLYTGKPCAYMLRKSVNQTKTHTSFGMKCINSHYIIKNKEDIINFIEDVIIKEKDYKKKKRNNFAKKEVMFNYPNSTEIIFNHLKNELINPENY